MDTQQGTQGAMPPEIEALESELVESVIKARRDSGVSQRELAKISGIRQPLISRFEKATHLPTIRTVNRILQPLGYKLAVVKEDVSKK